MWSFLCRHQLTGRFCRSGRSFYSGARSKITYITNDTNVLHVPSLSTSTEWIDKTYQPVASVRCLSACSLSHGAAVAGAIRQQSLQVPLFTSNCRCFATAQHSSQPPSNSATELTDLEYEEVSECTLYSLTEKFEELADADAIGEDFDVSFSNGVMTVRLGQGRGTYVINKQTPNKQIWSSSPFSGPKRYDFVQGTWVYKHDGVSLHQLLTKELQSALPGTSVDFTSCSYGQREPS